MTQESKRVFKEGKQTNTDQNADFARQILMRFTDVEPTTLLSRQ